MSAAQLCPDRVLRLVEEAARPVPLLWPLASAVAANPLWDLRDEPFRRALSRARQVLGAGGLPSARLLADAYQAGRVTDADLDAALGEMEPPGTDGGGEGGGGEATPTGTITILERHDLFIGSDAAAVVDREVAKYCAAYLAELLPPSTTRSGSGFFATWQAATATGRPAHRRAHWGLVASLGPLAGCIEGGPAEAIGIVLGRLGLEEPEAVEELSGQLARLPGWAAHAKWRSQWAAPDHPGPALELVDYLAVRLCYDLTALTQSGHGPSGCCENIRPRHVRAVSVPAPGMVGRRVGDRLGGLDAERAGLVWLAAYEGHYRDRLLAALDQPRGPREPPPKEMRAQVVCCIDARSEGLRRQLEALGGYETFGFAGFFGVPARLWPLASDEPLDLCPVLLRPTVEVAERPVAQEALERDIAALRNFATAGRAFRTAQKWPVIPFVVAEAAGAGLGPVAIFRTVAPTCFSRLRRLITDRLAPSPRVEADLDGPGAPSDEEQALYAEMVLRTMGLTGGFASVVVLCGHGSTSENNPYTSSLDCGACGATRGGRSARLAAAVLNRPLVRAALAERGVTIEKHTLFVAAEHDTTADTVTLYRPEGLGSVKLGQLAQVEADLARAGAALALERAATLQGAPNLRWRLRRTSPVNQLARRSADWAQVQPEWGLARCAAFIIGPRHLSAGVNLERRVFLHSYQPSTDPAGTALEGILTGPMIVAQWISAAYYHSTVDADILGAGDKVAHNVVAGTAVYQGAGGDLKLGLPRQAVFDQDRPYHEPMRLLVVVAAPRSRIDAVIDRNPVLAKLTDGEWINLVARDDGRFWLRRSDGTWKLWAPSGTRSRRQPPWSAEGTSRYAEMGTNG